MNNTNNPQEYKPAELEIIIVDQTDIICTSGGSSINSLNLDSEDL